MGGNKPTFQTLGRGDCYAKSPVAAGYYPAPAQLWPPGLR